MSGHRLTAPYPTMRHALILALIILPLLQLLLSPLLDRVSIHLSLAAAELGLLILVIVSARRHAWSMEDLFLTNATRPLIFLVVVPLTVAVGIVTAEVDFVVQDAWRWLEWTVPLSLTQSVLQLQIITDATDLVAILVVVVLLPAVCEEVFFRGFVYTGLRYHHGPRVAWIGSAAVFAAAHLNPWSFPALFLVGLFLGWLVHRSHSIYPAMLGHGLINLLSVVAINISTYLGIDPLGATQPVSAPVLAAALIVGVSGIWWLRKHKPLMPALSPFVRQPVGFQVQSTLAE